jgi:hypothetical protein
VLSLSYERRSNVIRIEVTGVLSSEDIAEHDRTTLNFLAGMMAREQKVRGLYDFRLIEALAIPISKIDQRGQRPAVIEGMRVVVAPPGTAGVDFAVRISEQLRTAGLAQPVVVETIEEAYRLLDLEDPSFEAIG